MSELAQQLPWDSAHFGVSIARAKVSQLADASQLESLLAWCRERDVACLYFLSDDDATTRALLEGAGADHVDERVTMAQDLSDTEAQLARPRDPRIRLVRPEDVEVLVEMTREGYRGVTRFYQDGRFAQDRCDALYMIWTRRSMEEGPVWVCELNGEAVGYLTSRYDEATKTTWLGLMALAEAARGQRLAGAMVQAALRGAVEDGMTHAALITQGRNEAARRTHERAGFHVAQTQRWYHLWL